MCVNGFELYAANARHGLAPRPRKIVCGLIAADVLVAISMAGSSLLLLPVGRARAPVVAGLVWAMVIAS
jgi:hypothetical protein